MKRFFCKKSQTDLNNINNETSENCLLNISLTVISEQIKQTIHRLLNDKVLRSDNILNEILKKIIHVIKNDLTQIINQCFISKMTSKSFCKFITVTLRKNRKKDYSLLNSYYFIVLKNTTAKLIKKLVTK